MRKCTVRLYTQTPSKEHRRRPLAHLPPVPELVREVALPHQAQQAAEDPELGLGHPGPEGKGPGAV